MFGCAGTTVAEQEFLPWQSFTRTTSAANYLAGGQAFRNLPACVVLFYLHLIFSILYYSRADERGHHVEFSSSAFRSQTAHGRIAA